MERDDLEQALAAVGDLLEAEGVHEAIVVVGGASLSLLGLVPRTTHDVDVMYSDGICLTVASPEAG